MSATATTYRDGRHLPQATEHLSAVATHPQPCLCGRPAVTTGHSHFSTDRPTCAACARVLRVLSFIHHDVTVSAS